MNKYRQIRLDAYQRAVDSYYSTLHATGSRYDANETATFARELEEIDAKLHEKKFPELKGLSLVPVRNVNPGVEIFTTQTITQFGFAEHLTDYSKDPPMAEVQGTEESTKLFSFVSGFQVTVQDVRRSKFMGIPLETKRSEAAKRVLDTKLNSIVFSGLTDKGVTGLANNANVSLVTSGINGSWSSASGADIAEDVRTLEMAVFEGSNSVEAPDTLVLPVSLYKRLNKPIDGSNITRSVLKFLMEPGNLMFIKNIEYCVELETAGAGSTPRAVVYKRDPDVLEQLVAIEFMTHPVMQRNLAWVTPCEMRCGGVVVNRPGAMRYCDVLD